MPAAASCILQLLLAVLVSGQVCLDAPLYIGGTDASLQYDDGTAYWLSWHGTYRGVWFNMSDFGYPIPFDADNTEFWFYHHSSYAWDTPCFYAELWNGNDISGPVTQLDQTSVTATHYAAVYANYPSPVTCESQFWVVLDTEMSGGGWPSILSDNTPQAEYDHSFYSYDQILWIPWVPSTVGLDRTTWGELKTLFDTPLLRSTPGCVDYFIRASSTYGTGSGLIFD